MKGTLLAFFICLSLTLFSQGTITGRITDTDSGEAMPFVNINVNPGNEGTVSDFDGEFKVDLSPKAKTLKFTYLGYDKVVIDLNTLNGNYVEVEMKQSNIMIDEAVVVAKKKRKIPKDTAAISLQQLVVDNKEDNRPSGFDSYEYREHTKIQYDYYKVGPKFPERKIFQPLSVTFDYIDTAENGTAYLPLLLQEKLSKHYYNGNPEQEKNIILGQYMTGVQNMSASDITSELLQNMDLYDNIIIAGGKPFTSPFSTTGLVTYLYFLTDSMEMDGTKYYRLDFTPKNNANISFTGYAWVEEGTYALQAVEFKVPTKANLNFVNDLLIKQSFEKANNGKWFLSGEEIQLSMNIRKKKDSKALRITKTMDRDSIQVDVPLDPSIFEGDKDAIADSAKYKSRDWWTNHRVDSLDQWEQGVLTMSDSIERTKFFGALKWLGYMGTTAFAKAGPVEFGRIYTFVSWNEIEGVRPKLGIRTNKDFNENIQFWGSLAYGTKDKEFKYLASARLKLPRVNNKWHMMQIAYQKDFTFLGQDYEEQKFSHDNIIQSITRGGGLRDIMMLEGFSLLYEKEVNKGLTMDFSINRTNFYSVDNVFDFEQITDAGTRENIPRFGVMQLGVGAYISFNQKFFENDYYRFPVFSNKPVIDLSYRAGLKGFADGDYNYHKFELDYYHRWSNKAGISKYNIKGGKVFGTIPYALAFLPIGNVTNFRNKNSYELMNEFEFVADQYAAFWLSHHFDGNIFNNIPGIKALKLRSIFIFKGAVGGMSDTNLELFLLPENMKTWNHYAEIGFGIENILQVARMDFMWRLTQRNEPDTRKFGVRFSFDLGL